MKAAKNSKKTALVIGAGSFGTAMAQVLTHHFDRVIIKVRSIDIYEELKNGENKTYLAGATISSQIVPALTWEEVDTLCDDRLSLIVSALPSSGIAEYFKDHYDRFLQYFISQIPLLSLSKGIDPLTLDLSDDIFFEIFPQFKDLICFLSGPSFAKEIMLNQITIVTLAGRSKKVLETVAQHLNTDYFKVLPSYDIKGVLLGGALKNILAISGGIVEGLGYNHNTRAALITRGIAEMLRFGKVFNARPETFYGMSGMGDLILTTTGDLSRNKSFGLEIAKGRKAAEIMKDARFVVEGYKTTEAAHLLSLKYDIKAQIFSGTYEVLYQNKDPRDIIKNLMLSPSKFEID